MSTSITPEDKLKLDEDNERMFAEVERCNLKTLKIAKETQTMILGVENSLKEIGPEQLDSLPQQSRNRISNKPSLAKPRSNIMTKIWNKIKWI